MLKLYPRAFDIESNAHVKKVNDQTVMYATFKVIRLQKKSINYKNIFSFLLAIFFYNRLLKINNF